MEGDHIKTYNILLPLAYLYGLGVSVRNKLFDCGILRSQSYSLPVIGVGNLSVGGTGKTPHTEYIIRLLKEKYQVAVLSRGYKRKSKGFITADNTTTMLDIGDEPFQMHNKYPDIHVAVDRNRCHGIKCLTSGDIQPKPDVILLDDSYQHRYVKPGINILLMDYHRLVYMDKLLPAGRLREPISSIKRADIVIVTKCPSHITPIEKKDIEYNLKLNKYQRLYFTTFKYGLISPLFNKQKPSMSLKEIGDTHRKVLLVSGIASPQQFEYDLGKFITFESCHFADHHQFNDKDISTISNKYNGGIIITTEKDASRMSSLGKEAFLEHIADNIYVLPIEVEFLDNSKSFDTAIINYVDGLRWVL